jgi:hypothetical protein
MEAISANDNMTMPNPRKVQMNDQKSPANPPSVSPCVFALTEIVNNNHSDFQMEAAFWKGLHQDKFPRSLDQDRETHRGEKTEISLMRVS